MHVHVHMHTHSYKAVKRVVEVKTHTTHLYQSRLIMLGNTEVRGHIDLIGCIELEGFTPTHLIV